MGGCRWVPIDELAALPSVSCARVPLAVTNTGDVDSQGDESQWSDSVRGLSEFDGSGVTIAVISDSYDTWAGATDHAEDNVENGDLPDDVYVVEDHSGTDEGRAMLQIVHDVAPGADLVFHTGYGGQAAMAAAILALADPEPETHAPADIIVDDLLYLAEPMFMDGVIAQAVQDVVGDGVAYFSAAGNCADNSYESAFRNSGFYFVWNNVVNWLHDFDPAAGTADVFQEFTLSSGENIYLSFQWDEPFESVTPPQGPACSNDLNIFVLDEACENILAWSDDNNVSHDPLEGVIYQNPSEEECTYNLIITWEPVGDYPELMKYVDFGSAQFSEYVTNSSTLFGHANTVEALAVGAAFYGDTPEFGTSPPVGESFTALGGTQILFDTDGDRLETPEDRMKPDVVGPDGVNTTFFRPDSADPEEDEIPNFFGTSAAAPHVAAVAALMLEAVPTATPQQIYDALESTAVDMASDDYDYLTGYGLVHALEALVAVSGGVLKVTGDHATSGQSDAITIAENGLNPDLVDIVLNGFTGSVKETSLTRIDAYGLGGNDTISADAALAIALHAFGGDGNDWLQGGAANDYLDGGAGNDTIHAGAGNDTVYGGAGHDSVYAGAGDDHVLGGAGNDNLYGYGGADVLSGDDGDDEVYGGEGGDYLESGYGVDDLWGEEGDDYLSVFDGEGDDTAYGGYGYDYAYGDYGDVMDAEEVYEYGEGARRAAAADGYPLTAEESIYAALQDQKSLQLWRELLWFYLEWDKKRKAS